MLAEGTPAPSFRLPDQHGRPAALEDFAGRWLILFWFPKAFTSGWTQEIKGFRDRTPDFDRLGVAVLGASFDTPEDNRAFAEQYDYPGRLLSDVDRTAGDAYETTRPRDDPSATFAKRRTFVIDPGGVIRKVYAVKDIPAHPAAVLEDLAALGVQPTAGG